MSLSTLGRTYTVDFHSMQQINEDTGTHRPVERRVIRPQALIQPLSTNNNSTTIQERYVLLYFSGLNYAVLLGIVCLRY